MTEWTNTTVSDLISEGVLERPMDGNHGAIHPKTSDFVEEGIPFIMASDMKNNRVDLENCSYISEEQARSLRKGFAKTGDVLLSHKATIGRTAIVGEIDTPFIMLTPQVTYYRVLRPEVLDRRYLSYYFRSREFRHVFEQWAGAGSTRAYIGITDQKRLPIRFPDIETQRGIARLVGALDDKIELNRRMSATLEEMARALYRSWFVDFDPVHARAEGRAPAHMDPATAALFPDRFGEDGLPEGWERKRLGDLLTLNYGKALKKSLREPGLYPVYGSGGTDTTHTQALISQPTIIVGRKGTVGSVMWEPKGCWPIDTTFYVTSSLPMPFVLRTLQALPLGDMNTDAAVPGLNRENAYRLQVAVPKAEILKFFGEMASTWQDMIDHLAAENQTLATLRDTLLPRLMSGELRIGEAAAQVEAVA